jgi:chemotaxis protein MotB
MKKISKKEGGGGGDSWLNTYADMVTLLLTFFVMLFTMSSIDAEKWKILVRAFSTKEGKDAQIVIVELDEEGELAPGAGEAVPEMIEIDVDSMPSDFNELYLYIKKYVEEKGLESSVTLEKGENSVFIRFQDNVFFDPDKSYLRKDAIPLLDYMGDCFLAVEDQILSIRINGHTATVPGTIKKPGFDRTLSSERANSVLIYFEQEKKIDPRKLISIGYGRNYPIADNSTEEGRKKNRRVEILILSTDFDLSEESDLFKYMTGRLEANIFEDDQNREEILIPPSAAETPGPGDTSRPDTQQTPPVEGRAVYEDVSPYDD